jgi:hypothetical protein
VREIRKKERKKETDKDNVSMKRIKFFKEECSWGGSASMVSDYRLDDRGSIAGRGKRFFL